MSDKDKGGDKTEQPTQKKLKDARKKGDIAKGKEITTALGTFGALLLIVLAAGFIAIRIATFGEDTVTSAASGEFRLTLESLASEAVVLLIVLSALILIPLAAVGLTSELLQTKALFASKKLTPKLDGMNPVEGIKRMFGKDGLVELLKTFAKALAVGVTVWLVARGYVDDIPSMLIPASEPIWREGMATQAALGNANRTFWLTVQVLGWVAVAFIFVAVLDLIWAKKRFTKKMMMSRRDIKDEMKRDEGDPHIKSHRRELAQEWAQAGSVSKTADASALLVNPTHLAIALDYNPETAPVPVILARGEGEIAAAMRAAAVDAEVPIVRHVQTARTLWARGEVGEMVPEEMFDAIAEVILWARKAKSGEAPMQCDLEAQSETEGSDAKRHEDGMADEAIAAEAETAG